MADTSKAEKLAAARKKLKQFQQKNKESSTNNARSTPCSQNSASPIDNSLGLKDQNLLANQVIISQEINHNFNNNNELISEHSSREHHIAVTNGTNEKSETLSLFSFENNSNVNNSSNNVHFFDNLSDVTISDSPRGIQLNNSSQTGPSNFEPKVTIVETPKTEQADHTDELAPGDDKETPQKITDLENLLHTEKHKNEELQKKLYDSHGHVLSLQQEIKRLNEQQGHIVAQEVIQLEEKLKFQSQTIEILVSEKTELQKELMTLQDENKSINSKREELASRLKASRSQVQKLEKDLSERTETKSQHNSILKKLENELQQKEAVVQELTNNLNSARNEIKELERRNEVILKNQEELYRQLQEKEKNFSMAQIKLTQLGGESNSNTQEEIESVKLELEKARKDVETAVEERKKNETELRQYITNLNAQMLQTNAKCERTEKDKEELTIQVENLIKHIADMEKQLQRNKGSTETVKAPEELETITNLTKTVTDQQLIINEKVEEIELLKNELSEVREKLSEADSWRENVPDMSLLQAAMESDRVAATRAVEQNNMLKQKLTELEEYIMKINNSKFELTEELDKYRHMAGEYRLQLEKYKSRQEMRMVDSVTQTINVKKEQSVTQTSIHDIAPISDHREPVSVETLIMIEEKLKKTMDKVADLSDEKQRLEHLVLQLQSETETIGEYVTLYQNQRSLLQEKAEEKERQMAVIAKERIELKSKLAEINNLLTKFPHNPEVENTTCKISSLVGEIQCSSIVQDKVEPPPTFHPCLLCSGKLITV